MGRLAGDMDVAGDDRHVEADQEPRPGRETAQHVATTSAVSRTTSFPQYLQMRPANPGVEQPEVVVDLGRRADSRARVRMLFF